MKAAIISNTAILIATLVLNGCVSEPSKFVKNAKAAEYNAKLGAEYLKQNRLKLAYEKLSKALQQNPNSSPVNHYYALLQEKLGASALAQRHFQKALKISSNNPELHNNYGSFLCKIGDYDQALSQFEYAIKDPLYKTPEFAYTNAGVCLKKSGKIQNYEDYFRNALQRKPQFALALYQMALLKLKQGNTAKAQAFLYRYHDVAKQTPKSLLLCKQIHDKLGEMVEADKCISQLLSNFPNSQAASKLSQ